MVLIGAPNLGTGWGGLALNAQGQSMTPNSPFLQNLNQNASFQLQGHDVIAIAGFVNGLEGDGLVGLWSAALNNLGMDDSRTRVLPFCHGKDLPTCTGPTIAVVTGEEHPTYQIIRSFLDDTDDWLSIGLSPTQAVAARTQPQVMPPPQPRVATPAPPRQQPH